MTSHFKTIGAVALGAALLAGPASAEQLSMATPWGGGPLLEDAANSFADNVELLTGNRYTVEVFPGGTLGKALNVTDTVAKGVAQVSHNWAGYDWGRDRTGVLFGGFAGTMPHDRYVHWLYKAGGADMLMDWNMDVFGVAAVACSSAPREIHMHSHKRIETLADYKGTKMRTSGAWAEIGETLGLSTVILAGSEVYPALERKVVDAIEWGGPAQNKAAGYEKIAKYIIIPGIHQPAAFHECQFNKAVWDGMSDTDKQIMVKAGQLEVFDFWMTLGHDDAIVWQEWLQGPNEVVDLSEELQAAAQKAIEEWAAAQGADNAWFEKVWKSQSAYAATWDGSERYR